MDGHFTMSEHQAIQTALSMSLSNFNGVFMLAAILARQGLITDGDVEGLHRHMLAPLSSDNVNEELAATQSQRIDELSIALRTLLAESSSK